MSRTMRCAQCGADLQAESVRLIGAAVTDWLAAGLIDPDQADRLRAAEGIGASSERGTLPGLSGLRRALTPGLVLLVVGGIVVVGAVAMVMADMWNRVGPWGRIAFAWGPLLALYAGGEGLRRRSGPSAASLAFVLFGALLAPFAIWVPVSEARVPFDPCCDLFGISHREAGRAFVVAVLSVAVHAATLFRYRAPLLTAPVCGSALFLLPTAAEWVVHPVRTAQVTSTAILGTGLALLAAGYLARRRGSSSYAVAPELVGSFATLFGTTILGADGRGAWELVAAAGPLAVVAAGCTAGRALYLPAGLFFLVLNIFRLGLEYFGDTIGLPISLLLCGLTSMAAGALVQRVRRGRERDGAPG